MDHMAVVSLNHVANTIVSNHIGSSLGILDLLERRDDYRSYRKQARFWRRDRAKYFLDIRGPGNKSRMHHIKGDPFPDEPVCDNERQHRHLIRICSADYPSRWYWITGLSNDI